MYDSLEVRREKFKEKIGYYESIKKELPNEVISYDWKKINVPIHLGAWEMSNISLDSGSWGDVSRAVCNPCKSGGCSAWRLVRTLKIPGKQRKQKTRISHSE